MRLRHRVTGVVVNVADGKTMAPEWVPAAGAPPVGTSGQGYSSWTVADLKAEISRRNEDRDDGDQLSPYQNKAELVEALEADDD